MNRSCKHVITVIILVCSLLVSGQVVSGQIVEKPKAKNPLKLEALVPKLDKSKPKNSQKVLTGVVSDTYHPDLIVMPKSGSGKAYEVGLKLYKDGDYRRAINAFTLAMIRGAKYGLSDPRVKNAKAAIKSTKSKLNLQSELGYKTDNKNPKELTGLVEKVFQPSLAWLGGLKEGDQITKASVRPGFVLLTVKRKKRIYTLKLKFKRRTNGKKKKLNLEAMVAKKDLSPKEIIKAGLIKNIAVVEKNKMLLARYDCALLVDTSGSMGGPVTAGRSVNVLDSKWGWCQTNCVGFYRKSQKYFPNGIMLVPFNTNFAVARGARSNEIDQVFNKLTPNGGTRMAAPLAFVLDDYFKRRKANKNARPLAIAVLTDGQVPLTSTRDVILDATSKMKYGSEIRITFLSIGGDLFGQPILKALDDDLVNVGAAYDIVDTRYFGEIQKYGLLKVIVAALVEHKAEGK